ncbi:MAG: exosortase/archaeosortase family protein [Verrucomicrobiota bacterium]
MSNPAERQRKAPPLWRGLLPLVIVAVLATQNFVVSAFGNFCKPIALFILQLGGLTTVDQGHLIRVAYLEVPWTRDCAGLNLLLVLLAVFAWMNRRVQQDKSYWIRLFLMIPAAIVANVLRVLSLIAYRFAVYPEVESPQLHYFLGFLWLVPFALLALPQRSKRPKSTLWFELLHISAVMGLLAPLLNVSSHWVTAVGALFCLANSEFVERFTIRHRLALVGWVLAAILITWSGIESLWLPWLVICPLTINFRWLKKPEGIVCLATSCPLFVLIPGADFLALAIFAYAAYSQLAAPTKNSVNPIAGDSLPQPRIVASIASCFLLLPFLATILTDPGKNTLEPPKSAEKRIIPGMGYELKLDGQRPELGMLWYDPHGSDRHHTIEVCLQYRGIELQPTEIETVKTDGQYWFKEFFLVQGTLVDDHTSYIYRTLGFRRDPGVHIIFVADQTTLPADSFAEEASSTADKLFQSLQEPDFTVGAHSVEPHRSD